MAMNNGRRSVNIGFMGFLTLIFISLKLTGRIDWSWIFVTAPLWIDIAFVIAIYLITVIAVSIMVWIVNIKNRKE